MSVCALFNLFSPEACKNSSVPSARISGVPADVTVDTTARTPAMHTHQLLSAMVIEVLCEATAVSPLTFRVFLT